MTETVGVYGFVGKNWQKNEFPVDLWVKHHEKIVDKISIVTHCDDIGFKYGPKVTVTHMDEDPKTYGTYRFYIDPLNMAQKILDTDWKILLPTDEFLEKKLNTSELDKRYAYLGKVRNLYGNISTELIAPGSSPAYQWRIHYGNREVFRDGGDVLPPYYAKFSPISLVKLGSEVVQRRLFLASRGASTKRKARADLPGSPRPTMWQRIYAGMCDKENSKSFTIWHTGFSKNPKTLVEKHKEQSPRDAKSGSSLNKGIVEILKSNEYDYHTAYKRTYRSAWLRRVDTSRLPAIILQNKKKFNWTTFSSDEYSR